MTTNGPDQDRPAYLLDVEYQSRLEETARRIGTSPEVLITMGINFMASYAELRDQDGTLYVSVGDEMKQLTINP